MRKTYERIAENWCARNGYYLVGIDNVMKGNRLDIQAYRNTTEGGKLVMESLTIPCATFSFKKPKDVETYIAVWGRMDDVVAGTKRGAALSYWKKNSPPRDGFGYEFVVKSGNRKRKLSYADVVFNRFWWKDFFRQDMKNYERLYSVFADAMAM